MSILRLLLKIIAWLLGSIIGILVLVLIVYFIYLQTGTPRLDRDWAEDQSVLADVSFEGDIVSIKNLRNYDYRATDDYTPAYYDEVFDLSKLTRAWYIIEPFGECDGPAHTMMSFDFEDDKYLSVSVEIRKEKGESFSALKGILNQYEIVYMLGDERDLVRLRSNYRKDDVYMFPIKASQEGISSLLKDMLERAQSLSEEPEFYHTVFNTCTTSLQEHGNKLLEEQIPWSKKILLPKSSDEILYDLGLIDTELSLEEAREYYHINERAEAADQSPDFSRLIRPEVK